MGGHRSFSIHAARRPTTEDPMSDLAPGGNDPDAGLTPDVGVSLHEWTTRWAQIEDDRADSPAEALEEAAGLLGEMLRERGVPEESDAATAETEDVTRAFEQARDVAERWRRDEDVSNEDIDDAFEEARWAFDYVAGGHRSGEQPDE
jgi:hypothetical protein